MGISKFGIYVASAAFTLVFCAPALAQTIATEAECLSQDGTAMDLNGEQHCFVPIIPEEFQTAEYAGEIKGVHSCEKENVRKTRIGDFCLLSLEAKEDGEMTEKPDSEMMKDDAEEMAEGKTEDAMEKKLQKLWKKPPQTNSSLSSSSPHLWGRWPRRGRRGKQGSTNAVSADVMTAWWKMISFS